MQPGSPLRDHPIVTISLCAALSCAAACDDRPEGSLPDAASPDALPAPSYDGTRMITLASGLPVLLQGPVESLVAVDEGITASELCNQFELSVTLLYDPQSLSLQQYLATAEPKDCPPEICDIGPSDSRLSDEHYARWLRWRADTEFLNTAGFFNHPTAVSFYLLASDESGFPWVTSVYSTSSLGPKVVLEHEGSVRVIFPPAWRDVGEIPPYGGGERWVRAIDYGGATDCVDLPTAITEALQLALIEDLSDCGIVFATGIGLNGGSFAWDEHPWCADPADRLVVVLTVSTEHPFFPTPCPRPAKASEYYECFRTNASVEAALVAP